ncbi:MMPL family transporter [Shewanella marina]|uniref:MMPL family transporter n=1 Tax=Shewanella marina TaxID=487319 RepID=UPI000B148965
MRISSFDSARNRLIIFISLLLLLVAIGIQQWQQGGKIQTDILAMLPHLQQDSLTHSALDRVESQLADRLYFGLVSPKQQDAIAAAKLLIQQLSAAKQVFTQVESGHNDIATSINKLYFPYRFNLLTQQQQQTLAKNDLTPLINHAQSQLYSAFGFASSQLLSQDPLLLYPANIQALAQSQRLNITDGILMAHEGTNSAAIVMAKGLQSAFNPQAQQAQSAVINHALQLIQQQYPEIHILKAGALFHAQAATQTAKTEISNIGSISLIGVFLLVWLTFRSAMPILMALLTISTGLVIAVVMTLVIFGEIHLITLVFGTSLIGIAIDYSFHFYCERLAQPNFSASRTIRLILPAISLALLTSALAYLGMGLAPFPGMQQVAVFCGSGLIGAYLTLILAYPLLANGKLPQPTWQLSLAQRYLQWIIPANPRTVGRYLVPVMALFIVVGISQLHSNDDIRQLQQSPASITQSENQLRQLLSGGTDNQFILVRGATEQALLQHLTALTPVLNSAQQQGEIGNFVSLARYIPSQQQQQHNYQLQQHIYGKNLHRLSLS